MSFTKEEINTAKNIPLENFLPKRFRKSGGKTMYCCPLHKETKPSFVLYPNNTFYCFGCFHPETDIQTIDGLKKIKNIVVGDLVLTKEGRFKKVTSVFIHKFNEELLEIYHQKDDRKILLTPNHNVFFINSISCKYHLAAGRDKFYKPCNDPLCKNNVSIDKKEARLLTVGEFLLIPPIKNNNKKYYIIIKNSNHHATNKIPPKTLINEDVAWLMGLFMADGSYNRGLTFSLGTKKIPLIKKIDNISKRYFDLKSFIHYYKKRENSIEVGIYNIALEGWFMEKIGKGAKNKKIPKEILFNNNRIKESFLNGYLSGDGYIQKNHFSASTISPSIAFYLSNLLVSLGYDPLIRESKKFIKNGVNHQKAYIITWGKNILKKHSFFVDKFLASRIEKIRKVDYHGLVYNLEVEEDHSYTANGVVVKNCRKSGDTIDFIRELSNVSFQSAVEYLLKNNSKKL